MKSKYALYMCLIFIVGIMVQSLPSFGLQRYLEQTERRRITANYAKAKKYYLEGKKYMKKGETDKALDKFLKSVETTPDFAESYAEIGNIYMKKGKNYYQKALKLDPTLETARERLKKIQ